MPATELFKYDIVDFDLVNGNIYRSFLNYTIGKGDSKANRFGVRLLKNGVPVTLPSSGTTCEGFFMAPDGQNILIQGTDTTYVDVENSIALVQLPQACYNVEGQFSLAIKVINSEITETVRIVDGVVCNTGVDSPVAPTGSVPTYQEVLAAYEDAIAAVEQAQEAIELAEDADGKIDNVKADYNITGADFRKIGGSHTAYNSADDDTFIYPLYQQKTGGPDLHLSSWDGYLWLRTPIFKVYEGQVISSVGGVHVLFFSDNNVGSYTGHEMISANSSYTIPSGKKYAALCMTYKPANIPGASDVIATMDRTVYYTENKLFEDEALTYGYKNVSLSAKYKTNGLFAIGCSEVVRGIASPYDGWVLYTDRPANDDIYPIAIATNGDDANFACQLCMALNRGAATATIFLMWSKHESAYSIDTVQLNRTLQGNMNGIRGYIKNNRLEISYVYEGEIVGAFGDVSPYYQALYDRMEPVTGCVVQTGSGENISYYGRGFKNYEDYYSFAKRISDDAQLVNHEARIQELEEGGGGGGGGGGETDWAKGLDLLDFGQEYMYAITNKLASGSAFKVLFTGDSTSAYYDGTGDGLKEILQDCMNRNGFYKGTYVNRAVSGINASTWKDNYLAGDIAEAPTLYIIRHGFNNESGLTEDEMAENFRVAMNSALQTIRASLSVHNCSIILMTPNTSNDDENSRGISMKKKLDPIIRNLARTYGCGFIDTFRIFYDPGANVGDMYDNPYGDGRHIHPNGLMNRLIVSRIFEFIGAEALRRNGYEIYDAISGGNSKNYDIPSGAQMLILTFGLYHGIFMARAQSNGTVDVETFLGYQGGDSRPGINSTAANKFTIYNNSAGNGMTVYIRRFA